MHKQTTELDAQHRGTDWPDVLAEMKREREMLKGLGLNFADVPRLSYQPLADVLPEPIVVEGGAA